MPVKVTTGKWNDSVKVACIVDCVKIREDMIEGNVSRSYRRGEFSVKGYDVYFQGVLIGSVESDRVETQYSSGNVKWCTHTTEATRWSASPARRYRNPHTGRTHYSRLDYGTRKEAITDLLDEALQVGTLVIENGEVKLKGN